MTVHHVFVTEAVDSAEPVVIGPESGAALQAKVINFTVNIKVSKSQSSVH
jgi:hypothetical protein